MAPAWVEPPPQTERSTDPANPLLRPAPRPYGLWRHALRFVCSRLRLMCGGALSVRWGLDRGLPAHRYYVRLFLREFQPDIRGRCLEFDDRDYLDCFGGLDVEHTDVLHLDHSNPKATVVADITSANDNPDDTYDCIICTHVLHVIPDFRAAVMGLHRILKPGGVLLVAVPQSSMTDADTNELWRFTALGLALVLGETFGPSNVTTRSYGNSLVVAGELRGLVADEYTWRELHTHDPRTAVEACARAVKQC